MIRPVVQEDIQSICDIYNYYVKNTAVTFEESEVTPSEMEERIKKVTPALPWLVYEKDGAVAAFAYADRWKGRSAYRFSAESTVYVAKELTGNGIGTELFSSLIKELKKTGTHAVIAGLSLPNEKSQKMHEKLGFKKVAHFNEVGFKFNKWFDLGYWQAVINN